MNPQDILPFTRPDIDEDTIAGVVEVLRSGWITTGPWCARFEQALSDYFGGRPVLAYSSGTVTMEIALRLLGVGPGDEVITTPLSWVATSNVILAVGATPVFVDIDPATRNIDANRIEAAITARTRAILPVHLAGLPADLDAIYAIAARHGLRVIEDAAQAIGSLWKHQRIGRFGDFASFSFHPNKNITSIEGGCLVLPADADVDLARRLRLQGVQRSGLDGMDVDVVGGKSNLTDVAARVGWGQLQHIERFNARRRDLAQRYFAAFDALGVEARGVQLPPRDFIQSNWHMFQIVPPPQVQRAALMQALKDRGITTGVHYPPIHLFSLYRKRGFQPGGFPHAETVGASILTLPLFPGMQDSDVTRVTDALDAVLRQFGL
ncbi:uridine 5'-(beta-1-threo-pentapyranosyl-4-ulose diphosphate) aminotransferase, PLP-dependent [Thiomonas arsenitoxydans]|uniref:DegT/DnrJ/EryC1/StrS aminotransferase n=1 Tax=Thiomonas arsenitoxydans (strain DSM 22701 / CIP 110005 / 3As) TaxID=426114 RepID=D6CU42_THIA3|nr:DegT/DnrJ/EryC1/StrS aminotransferase family protein [Thiomonas arsenitoxydans]CQR41304.1 uridine 5'-(beta-1-threo-pentapyranosyl-4-ulose diphosphate) aminotransferase, PLP-dependent [Thiomonas sp. CB3]CAZ88811.1 putative DegT/DnrJ/EryC1/StrS aminotransferase [Thiomonas arsenitoxydans]CQR26313.1 uridine 5'-(beta-1-threo-pentapyranosyl-4-ulose diphosphate) aminotransferase, PLP-dependent [Thiomonas arsenitoxydans]CQR28438.1 uridine 5'-(beta-1-threo-pentapyranosyl-4-ulose diphosphate) aminotra